MSASKKTVSPVPLLWAVRRYSGAGNTMSSHCVTESRKLATITVSATDRARLATTPLVATAVASGTRRARSCLAIVRADACPFGCRLFQGA